MTSQTIRSCVTIFIENKPPQTYDLSSFGTDCVRMGRGPYHGEQKDGRNDIALPADFATVSRAHCTFYRVEGVWYISDDRSVNGLSANGARITSKQLHDGDRIYIGQDNTAKCVIAFSSQRAASAAAGTMDMDSIPLTGRERYVIGRGGDCDVVLRHPAVSRQHCVITFEDGQYYISDHHSVNGVILNGVPLTKKQKLEQMDKITIADTSILFCDGTLHFNRAAGGVSVVADDICKEVRSGKGTKCITNHVSLSIEPGEFVAIIGGSGAGKTTLLNCLSGMTDFTSGDIHINGESIRTNSRSVRSIIGYVPQSDIVYDNLTLERMLLYSAQLRMPKDTSGEEIQQKIEETLEMVELTAHRATMISRLSGGQRKRASIAVELLASPRLFFLDEPSSGLDPGTEKNLMTMLKRLANTGKTVIMVTHTVQNINMCDRVICMGCGGLLGYSGSPRRALEFFGKKAMTDIYEDLNEHSIEVSNRFQKISGSNGMAAQPARVEKESGQKENAKKENSKKEKKKFSPEDSLRQFAVMTKRYAEILKNSRMRLMLLALMPVILTILVCIAFQADGNLYSLLNITIDRTSQPFHVCGDTMKLMFAFSCAAFWVGIFNSIQEVSKERNIYEREHFTGVRSFPYVMSKFADIGVLCMLQSLIMMALLAFFTSTTVTAAGNAAASTSFRIGMGKDGVVFTGGGLWFEMYLTTFLAMMSAMCLGLAISSAVSNDMALVVCPVCLLPQILFSGVVSELSGITETISNIVTCRWANIAYFTSAGTNDLYAKCEFQEGKWETIANGVGISGYDEAYNAARTYIFGLDPVKSAWVVLSGMAVLCIAVSVLLLHFRKSRKE